MLKSRTINIIFSLIFFIVVVTDVFGHVAGWMYAAPLFIYVALQVYGSFHLSAGFFIPVIARATHAGNAIALTFDDGPVAGKTDKLLDILRTHNVRAAFFCIGHRVKEHSALVQRINREGHLLGNHSYWHGKTFDLQSSGKIAKELKETDLIIRQHTGVEPRFFRPPYGVTNPMVADAIKSGHHITIGWSVRSLDTVIKDSSRLLKRIKSQLKAGDIVLFHDHSDSMLEILPALLDHVSQLGLKIVRLDELLNEKAYV